MEQQAPGKKQFEARMIQLLTRRFEQAKLTVKDHFKVGELPLEIDLLVKLPYESSEGPADLPALFQHFRRHNVMELKTEVDPLEIGDLVKLQAYAWHYMFKDGIYTIADVTATAIAHHLTAPVQAALPALGYEPISKGIFKRTSDLASFLISIEDVPDELVPEELQIFSNAVRRKRVFFDCYNNPAKSSLLNTLTDLYEKEVVKLMVALNFRDETMPKVIDALGRERVLAALSKEERISSLSKEELMSFLSKEELMSSLSKEELMSSLSKEEHMAALDDDDLLTALQKKEQLLKALLARLEPERLRKLISEVGRA